VTVNSPVRLTASVKLDSSEAGVVYIDVPV
jgi:hypothetical protein